MHDDGGVQELPSLDSTAALLLARRTNLRIDRERPVDPELIKRLCALATWAPNHHLTEPWRFAVVTGEARAELGRQTAAHMADLGITEEAKLEKARTKFLRAPVMLVVACASAADASPGTRAEDRDAVAAATQNLLLAATAAGLWSYWGSGAVTDAPGVKAMCALSPSDTIVAAVYLGWPGGEVPMPVRHEPIIAWVP